MRLFFRVILLLIFLISLSMLSRKFIYDVSALVKIDPKIKTKELIAEKKFVEANDYLDYFLQFDYVKNDSEALELKDEIEKQREKLEYKVEKVLDGLLKGYSDESIGNISAIASDFFLFGDIRDLVIQGSNYINDEEVDEIIVALSSIGIAATVATHATAEAAAPVKSGISTLKLAKKSNKIPNWLIKTIKGQKRVDKTVYENISTISKTNDISKTIELLSISKSANSLTNIANLSKTYGKNTIRLMKISGKNSERFLDSFKYFSKEIVLEASTYGKNGLKALSKFGTKRFLLRMGKTSYKGNFNNLYYYLLNNIPTWILILTTLLPLLYFVNLIFKSFKMKKGTL